MIYNETEAALRLIWRNAQAGAFRKAQSLINALPSELE